MRHQPSSGSIRVLVCDDNRVHTELLADTLKRAGGLQVTTSVSGSEGLATRLDLDDVDVLLISSNLDNRPGYGFEVLRGVRALHADLRAVVLLDGTQGEMTLEAFRAGARGIFSKDDSIETLGKCLRKVHEGQIWANTDQITNLVHALASSHNIRAVDARGLNLLSKRDTEVVRGVALGLSNREIAERLHLSEHTIKNKLFRIFDKLGVSNRVELLFMTLSQERHAQSALQYFINERAYEGLRDEATLVACRDAAMHGVLMAQVALAQFFADQKSVPDASLQAYVWSSIAAEQVSQLSKMLAKDLSLDQLLKAEEMASERLSKRNRKPVATASNSGLAKREVARDALRSASSAAAYWP
jgi:DNA-binding NarL/FixJ family response regulator